MKFEENHIILDYEDAAYFLMNVSMALTHIEGAIYYLEQKVIKTQYDLDNEKEWKEKEKIFKEYYTKLHGWVLKKMNEKFNGVLQ